MTISLFFNGLIILFLAGILFIYYRISMPLKRRLDILFIEHGLEPPRTRGGASQILKNEEVQRMMRANDAFHLELKSILLEMSEKVTVPFFFFFWGLTVVLMFGIIVFILILSGQVSPTIQTVR